MHALINAQEACLSSGLAAVRQIGTDCLFKEDAARRPLNYYGFIMFGNRFHKA